ncbi:hypothetical protein D3C72_2167160 [compost metagenome]
MGARLSVISVVSDISVLDLSERSSDRLTDPYRIGASSNVGFTRPGFLYSDSKSTTKRVSLTSRTCMVEA